MGYSRLGLENGILLTAEHIGHIETGIVNIEEVELEDIKKSLEEVASKEVPSISEEELNEILKI